MSLAERSVAASPGDLAGPALFAWPGELAALVERRDFAFSADGQRAAWVADDQVVWSDGDGTPWRSAVPGGLLPPGTHLELVSHDLIGVCRSTDAGVELLAVDTVTGTGRTIASFMTPRTCLLPRPAAPGAADRAEQWVAVNRFDGTCTLYRFSWETAEIVEAGRLPMAATGGVWLSAGKRLALNLVTEAGRASVYAIDVEAGQFNLFFEASPDSEDRIALYDEDSALAVFTTDAFGYPAVGVTTIGQPGSVRFFPPIDEGDEAGTPCALVETGGRVRVVLRHEAGVYARLRLADPEAMTISAPLPVPDGEVGAPVAACATRLRFPFSTPDQPWRAAALDFEGRFSLDAPDRDFRSGRGLTFAGPSGPMPALLVEPDPVLDRGDLAVVALHGGPIARTGAEWKAEWQLFTGLGLPVVALDYPGSTGWGQRYMRSLFGHAGEVDVAAVRAVIDDLAAAGRRVVLYGESYGAFLALLAGAARPCAGIIALAPFASFSSLRRNGSDEVRDVLELLDGGNSDETGRNALEACRIIRSKVLIVHGTADRTIPVDESRALVAALRERRGAGDDGVTFVELERQGHELSGSAALARCYLEIARYIRGLR